MHHDKLQGAERKDAADAAERMPDHCVGSMNDFRDIDNEKHCRARRSDLPRRPTCTTIVA